MSELITHTGNGRLRIGVKEPLKVPFIFLFILICTTFVCAVLDMLTAWGLYESAGRFTLAAAVQKLPRSLYDVLIPSVVLSIVLLGFRLARRRFSRFVALFIVLAVGYLCLANGMLLLRPRAGASPAAGISPAQYFPPATFVRVGERMINVRSVSDTRARAILVYDPSRNGARFTVAAEGTAVITSGAVKLTTAGPMAQSITGTADLPWTSVFAADRFTALFLRDVRTLTADFQRLLVTSRAEFLASSFALVFLCAASLMLLRITRWPLLNIMVLGIAVRGYFSLYHFLAVSFAPQLAQAVTDSFVVRMFPPAVFICLGVIFLLMDILFIPADRWVSEPAR
ncbi:MAG: hypothetical protein ACLQDL_06255 [Spirochaetia bacterium]